MGGTIVFAAAPASPFCTGGLSLHLPDLPALRGIQLAARVGVRPGTRHISRLSCGCTLSLLPSARARYTGLGSPCCQQTTCCWSLIHPFITFQFKYSLQWTFVCYIEHILLINPLFVHFTHRVSHHLLRPKSQA